MRCVPVVLGVLMFQVAPVRTWGQAPEAGSSATPRVIFRQNTEINLDDVTLEADARTPDNFEIVRKTQTDMGSLLRRRTHFHDKLLRDSNLMK